jgi:ribonuclease HII
MAPRKQRETLGLRFKIDDAVEVGVDEAGRGCFWGPLVAGAVIWPPETEWTDEHRALAPQIQDSKLIAKKKRAIIAASIKRLAVATGVGIVEASEIDVSGMTTANQEAFRRALNNLAKPYDRVIIDGILRIDIKDKDVETIVDGDAKYLSIAAASIIAKVAHDEIITAWCEANSEAAVRYDLASCMGYGTAKHRAGIKEHGLLESHRRLFMRNILPSSDLIKVKPSCLIQDD